MKRSTVIGILMTLGLMASTCAVHAADVLTLQGIGTMSVPKNISFVEGVQSALPFLSEGGTKRYFIRNGFTKSQYFTMTYKDGPDFSYGWAMSHEIGIPYLLEIGEIRHKNDSAEEQMDVVAAYLNQKLAADGVVFTGPSPLVKVKDNKYPRWEGSFVKETRENDIIYREAYVVVLQSDGYFNTLGIINSDADRSDITDALKKMMAKRKFPKRSSVMNLSSRVPSLTEFE